MSYSTAGAQKFTMIDDLPDLDDLEGPPPHQRAVIRGDNRASQYPGSQILPDGQEPRFRKFIRDQHVSPTESGMARNLSSQAPMMESSPAAPEIEAYHQAEETNKYSALDGTPSCLNVAEHISGCPICSKFYNDDKSIYIIAIIVLAVICILLLKKVLDR